jgi:hypothetical protein
MHGARRGLVLLIATRKTHCHPHWAAVLAARSEHNFNSVVGFDRGTALLRIRRRNNAKHCWLFSNESCVTVAVILFKNAKSE